MKTSNVKTWGFQLDYENPGRKIIDNSDQIDIFALFDDDWTVRKKVAKQDGTYVSFVRDDPDNAEALPALNTVVKAFKEHFQRYPLD